MQIIQKSIKKLDYFENHYSLDDLLLDDIQVDFTCKMVLMCINLEPLIIRGHFQKSEITLRTCFTIVVIFMQNLLLDCSYQKGDS